MRGEGAKRGKITVYGLGVGGLKGIRASVVAGTVIGLPALTSVEVYGTDEVN